ncbi:MAG: hypothetical protein KME30_13560 [Iphinoe sp. HA4291-MV1]|nr:hypothetical protein [Iphinoe sp. HA4291-MV1]
MRAAISLLITGLFFGSIAVNNQALDVHISNSGSQQLMAATGNTSKLPRRSYRGSGRKQLVQYIKSTYPVA